MSASATSATTVATGTIVVLCSIALAPGVWSISGNIFYAASSGTVTTIQCVYASISTSTGIDTQYST